MNFVLRRPQRVGVHFKEVAFASIRVVGSSRGPREPMARTGRNDPCPCGSGKKFKRCCGQVSPISIGTPPSTAAPFSTPAPSLTPSPFSIPASSLTPAPSLTQGPWGDDLDWLKIRRTEGELMPEILDFAEHCYGRDILREAIDEFYFRGRFHPDHTNFDNFFEPWLVFNWIPEEQEIDSPRGLSVEQLALEYLRKNRRRLDSYQQAFIRTACAQPFSFFAITEVEVGKSLGLRDLLLDRIFTVKEASASKTLQRGDVVFARVVPLGGQAIMVGMGPTVVPPRYQPSLFDSRDTLKKLIRNVGLKMNLESVGLADKQMREIYLDLIELASNPARPELVNTDGDPINLVKLYFEINCSPREALDSLKSLALPEFQDEIFDDSASDAEGNLVSVSFDWLKRGNKAHKQWDNTILGRITIEGNKLTAQVNSDKRAKKIRSLFTRLLGKQVTYKRSVYESMEQKLSEVESSPPDQESLSDIEDLNSRPEVQALIEEQVIAHWEAWYTTRVPALENKTPIQAARTKAGRERLEALLCDFERRNEEVSERYLRVDVGAMRKKLGL